MADWNGAHPDLILRAWLMQELAAQAGVRLRFTSAVRSRRGQADAAREARRLGLPAATPDTSRHVTGRAFDVVFAGLGGLREPYSGAWMDLGRLGEALGLRWGGRFRNPDPLHFDLG